MAEMPQTEWVMKVSSAGALVAQVGEQQHPVQGCWALQWVMQLKQHHTLPVGKDHSCATQPPWLVHCASSCIVTLLKVQHVFCLPTCCFFYLSLLSQASNISDALVRPHAAEAAAHCAAEAGECYDEDGNPEPVPQRVPSLPGPPVHPVQVRQHHAAMPWHLLSLDRYM